MSRDPLDARIAVIGAGPAGLSAAWYLKQKGYRDVLVLEKLGRVGGLCKSITDGYMSFDLGGNYITPSYKETRKIARSVGAKTYRGKKYMQAQVEGSGANKKLTFRSIKDFVMEDADTGERIPYWKMAWGVVKFAYLRWKVREFVDAPTFDRVHERPDLCVSFSDWLDHNELGFMKRMFEIPVPMMGYGLLDEIVTPYVLKYMAPGTYGSMILRGLPGVGWLSPWPRRFALGFQRMWEQVSWGLNVRMEVGIEGIQRTKNSLRPIEITLTHPDRVFHRREETRVTHYFDRIIICCPLTLAVLEGQLHMDLQEQETDVFRRIQTYSYCQTTIHAVDLTTGKEEDFHLPAPVVPITPFSRSSVGYPWVVVQVWENASRMLQFYSRLDPKDWVDYRRFSSWTIEESDVEQEDASRKIVLDRVRSTLELMGGAVAGSTNPRLKRWRTFHRWPYFGHVTPGDFRAGFYEKFEGLQGLLGTYYAGGATTFELIESVVCSSKHAVEKLDADLRSDPTFAG
ncbi:MAG: FAD-dependent oxidoreductase [Myxococcota bacterium]